MRVCILVANPIFSDVRVRKQLRALTASGRYEVHAIGLTAAADGRPTESGFASVTHEIIPLDRPPRGVGWGIDVFRRASAVLPSGAWAASTFFACPRARGAMLERAVAARADLYHANDWNTLPVACEAAARTGARVVYDAHEMGIYEFSSLKFRVFRKKLIERLEAHYLPRVDRVVAVCQSIADELVRHYRLDPARAGVIRNAAEYEAVARRPLDPAAVRVLYHGGANAGRGLEDLIDSVALWRPHLALTLRLVGHPDYLESLKARARERGLAARITFAEPVPTTRLVAAASEFDVGVNAIVGSEAWNNRICLPNKLFEYAMAGLAVYVTDLPEMRALVVGHGLGGVFAERDPAALAAALNAATPESLRAAQERSLAFSKEVNATTEFAKLIAIYDELLAARSPAGIGARGT